MLGVLCKTLLIIKRGLRPLLHLLVTHSQVVQQRHVQGVQSVIHEELRLGVLFLLGGLLSLFVVFVYVLLPKLDEHKCLFIRIDRLQEALHFEVFVALLFELLYLTACR